MTFYARPIAIAAAIALCLSAAPSADAAKKSASLTRPGKTLYGQVDEFQMLLNAAGLKLSGPLVDKVMLGSPAYYAGLRQGDKVVNCEVGDNILKVGFDRAGKRYGANIATHPAAMRPTGAVVAAKAKTKLSEPQALNILKNFDIVLFLDCSGSMGDNIRSEGRSKWDWAHKYIQEFNTKYNEVAHRNITFVMFNDNFKVVPNATMKDVEKVFSERRPEGGTDLAEPLAQVLADKMKSIQQRPCIIAVLHDGLTSDERAVGEILEKAAGTLLKPGQLQVTFLQIGDDTAGANAMKMWDDADFGAKEIVSAKLFDDLKTEGLARAIADAIDPHTVIVKPPVPNVSEMKAAAPPAKSAVKKVP